MASFIQRKPWGAKRINPEIDGSVRIDGLQSLEEALQSFATGLINPSLLEGTREGFYNPETMSWEDGDGGKHSQRCNARGLVEGTTPHADHY